MSAERVAATDAAEAWAEQVRAGREQIDRLREIDEPADFYELVARRFALDPHRADDESLEILRSLARPGDTWLDIGAGGGRDALPLALGVRSVIALEPSESMRKVLRAGMAEHGISNIQVIRLMLSRRPTAAACAARSSSRGGRPAADSVREMRDWTRPASRATLR